MGLSLGAIAARVGYALLFCVVLPGLLWAWAAHARVAVDWPLPAPPTVGVALLAAGALLMLSAMHALWRHGGGLPMNAFPPPRLVTRGPYAIVGHPIYVGFVAMTAGTALAAGSAVAFYLVTPVVALGAVALVLGHEGPALRARFPDLQHRPWLSLPRANDELHVGRRIAVALLVLLPWLLLYLWAVAIGPTRDAVAVWLPGEDAWPVVEGSYLVYASAYPITALAPFWARGAERLGDFARAGLAATALHTFLYLVVPIVVPPRAFEPATLFGEWLAWEGQNEANGAAAFPSFHTTWALLTAVLAARSYPRLRWLAAAWAVGVAWSCSATGMHAVADVIAGALTFTLVHHRRGVWAWLRAGAQRLGNSMRWWRLGPLRVFVHAAYAGPAAFVVAFTVVRQAAPGDAWAAAIVCVAAVVGAAAWAQWIEGAAVSLRPFGYYGAMLGGIAALTALAVAGVDIWPIAGGLAIAAPFAQAIGRLRCLVQGCCHGRPAPADVGIVCTHPWSRIVRLAHAGGVPLHPTPLYSILWNVPCGVALLRAAQLGQPPSVVAGCYFVLAGLGRFVEEAYRGEPQTRRWAGLIEYQWYALLSLVVGAVLTCLPSAWPLVGGSTGTAAIAGAAIGLMVAIAMGVDVPDSNRRFARLLK